MTDTRSPHPPWYTSTRTRFADPVLDLRLRRYFETHRGLTPGEDALRGAVFDLVTSSRRVDEALEPLVGLGEELRALASQLQAEPSLNEIREALVAVGRSEEAARIDAETPLAGGEYEADRPGKPGPAPAARMALPPRPYAAPEDPAPESKPPPSDHLASPHPVRTELRELPASDATSLPSDDVELLRQLRAELRDSKSTPPPSDDVELLRQLRAELRELRDSKSTPPPPGDADALPALRTELRELRASVTQLDQGSRDASVETTLKEVLAKLHLLELRLEHSAETLRFASWTALACLVVAALLAVLT